MACKGKCNCKKDASEQLNYELGIMMFRGITQYIQDAEDYDIDQNCLLIINELNDKFIFDKEELRKGFSNEYKKNAGCTVTTVDDLFEAALDGYKPILKK